MKVCSEVCRNGSSGWVSHFQHILHISLDVSHEMKFIKHCVQRKLLPVSFVIIIFLLSCFYQIVQSDHGLLTTVAYKLGKAASTIYALEGSVAIAGAAVRWLRDNLSIIKTSADIEPLAKTVKDSGGVYFVPAFSGLFAPYWRTDARG